MNDLLEGLKENKDEFCNEESQFHLNSLKNHESITVKPEKNSIPVVEEFIENKMEEKEIGMREMNKINISVDELFTNIVSYSKSTWAEATCNIDEKQIKVILRDNGIPYNPLEQEAPDVTLSIDEREIGGLGIFMARKLTDCLEYQRVDEKNETTLIINRKK